MGNGFHYRGTLDETSLGEMLYTVYRHRVPGVMELSNDGIVKRLHISNGAVIHAASTDRTDRLGAHLYRVGKISRKDLVETMRLRGEGRRRYGEILVENELLSPAELREGLHGHMEAIIWSLFSWMKGDVSFRIGDFTDPIRIRLHLPLRQVILQGIQRASDAKALVARLGKKTTVFRPAFRTEDLIEIGLRAEDYRFLRLVDGKRTLYDLCTEGPHGVSENARLVYAFHVLNLVERVEEDAAGSVRIRVPTESSK